MQREILSDYEIEARKAVESFSQVRVKSNLAYDDLPEDMPFIVHHNVRLKKNKFELKKEQKRCLVVALEVILAAFFCFSCLFAAIFTSSYLNEKNIEFQNQQENLKIVQSENVQLSNKINIILSTENVDKYAIEELGMVKNKNVIYIDTNKYNSTSSKNVNVNYKDN